MMRTIEEIRHARLLQLLQRQDFPTIQSFADRIERSYAQVSQWKNRSKRSGGGFATIDSASARLIEEKTGEPKGWMDNDPAFDAASSTLGQPAGATGPHGSRVSESDWEMLQDIKLLSEAEQASIRETAHNRAQAIRAGIERELHRLGIKRPMPDA